MPTISAQRVAPAPRRGRTSIAPSQAPPAPLENVSSGGQGSKPGRSFLRRWLTAAMLLVAAVLAVGYIANAIAVNELAGRIESIQRERDAVRSDNERLRAELLRQMSVERITAAATTKLGLVQPAQPPFALSRKGGR